MVSKIDSKSASYSSSSSSSSEDEVEREKNAAARARILPYGIKEKDIKPKPELPFYAIRLCGNAENNANLYCEPKQRTSRIKTYKKEEPKEYGKDVRKARITVLKKNAAMSSAVMGVSVIICGGLGSIGWVAGPAGGAPGTTLGIGAGLAIGGYVIKRCIDIKIPVHIEFSDHYQEWRTKAIADKVYPLFRNFLDVERKFDHFHCPIRQDICSLPMLAPDMQTYNYEEINKYISKITDDNSITDKDNFKVKSPVRGKSFSRNDLVLNVQYCKDLITKAQEVHKEVVTIGKDNEIKYGLQAVIDNTRNIMQAIRKEMRDRLWLECEPKIEAGKMTIEEAFEYVRKELAQWEF